MIGTNVFLIGIASASLATTVSGAGSPFASSVVEYAPGPGIFTNDPLFNEPQRAFGAPVGGGMQSPDTSSLVTLGGFIGGGTGGSITLAFDHRVMDDATNPFGMDAIVFGNAFYFQGLPTSRFAEGGIIEISRDDNENGLADDAWFVIAGSHLSPPCPSACELPSGVFGQPLLNHPDGTGALEEVVYGYADVSPTLLLGDTDADDTIDDPLADPEVFYTSPDDPMNVGITPGSGGGDAFDIAWAVDPTTGTPANLDGFDFIRIRTGLDALTPFGEVSPEIDAIADVAPVFCPADVNADGSVGPSDFTAWLSFFNNPSQPGAGRADLNGDDAITPSDFTAWLGAFNAGCGG